MELSYILWAFGFAAILLILLSEIVIAVRGDGPRGLRFYSLAGAILAFVIGGAAALM